MTDHFDLLGVPRRPWIDPEQLKARFHQVSNAVHPDRVHGSDDSEKERATSLYATFNQAYTLLKEPKDRLLHLLELEIGGKPGDIQRIPPGTMDLFVEVGQLCRDTDVFLVEKNNATSPMLKVKLFAQGMDWTEKLQELQFKLNQKRDELSAELVAMNSIWESAVSDTDRKKLLPLERLEQIYRTFSYVARWTGQIQERIVQLAF